jgi:predicted glutamine amidotransferase
MSQTKGNYFDKLLYIDAFRGQHSTGVATIEPVAGEVKLLKMAEPACDFVRHDNYQNFKTAKDIMWLGHNRYATVGNVNDKTAHPFDFSNVVGMHNGTLAHGWKSDLDNGKDFEVDSECLYYNINKNGLKETLERTYGAMALIMYMKDTHELVFLRNDKRTLFYGFTEDKRNLVILSDADMHTLANRYAKGANVKFLNNNKMTVVPTETIMRLPLPDSDKFTLTPDMIQRETWKPPVRQYSNYGSHYSGWGHMGGGYHSSDWRTQEKKEKKEREARGVVLDFHRAKKGNGEGCEAVAKAEERLKLRIHNNDYVDFVCRSVVWENEEGHSVWKSQVESKIRVLTERLANMGKYTSNFTSYTGRQADIVIEIRQELTFYKDLAGCLDLTFWELWHEETEKAVKEEPDEKKPVEGERTYLPALPAGITHEEFVKACADTPCSSCKCTDDEPDPLGTILFEHNNEYVHVCKECVQIPMIWQMVIAGEFDDIAS